MERLEKMFELQEELMKHYSISHPVDIDTLEGQNKIREMMFYVAHELFEASEWLKIKPWRKTIVKTDLPAFQEEIADVVHFFLELCIILNIDAEKLYNLYVAKVDKNIDRIKEGY